MGKIEKALADKLGLKSITRRLESMIDYLHCTCRPRSVYLPGGRLTIPCPLLTNFRSMYLRSVKRQI